MRYRLISCEVLYREMCAAVARSIHQVDVVFMSKGLHDLGGSRMGKRLQERIDETDPAAYDAVLLGYGLCANGAAGLRASRLPVVLPRARDCAALLMGGQQKFLEYSRNSGGARFRSSGWLERLETPCERSTGLGYELDDLVERYGEENGRSLYEDVHRFPNTYSQLTFIETGLEPNTSFEDKVREEAQRRGWSFDKVEGSLSVFERLVNGEWNESEFLVLPPGYQVVAGKDPTALRAEKWAP